METFITKFPIEFGPDIYFKLVLFQYVLRNQDNTVQIVLPATYYTRKDLIDCFGRNGNVECIIINLPCEFFLRVFHPTQQFFRVVYKIFFPLNFAHVATKTILINYGKHIYTTCFTCVHSREFRFEINTIFNRTLNSTIYELILSNVKIKSFV